MFIINMVGNKHCILPKELYENKLHSYVHAYMYMYIL